MKTFNKMIATCMLALLAIPVLAGNGNATDQGTGVEHPDRGDVANARLDAKGNRIDSRLDAKGNRIGRRVDRRRGK